MGRGTKERNEVWRNKGKAEGVTGGNVEVWGGIGSEWRKKERGECTIGARSESS